MNLRRQQSKDSLDLLLDTMCNAFGGIILLAVLVALLARQSPSAQGNSPDSTEMLARRIARAELEISQLRALIVELNQKVNDPALRHLSLLVEQRQSLLNRLSEIKSEAERERREQGEEASTDPASRLQEIKAQIVRATTALVEARNSLDTIVQENQRLRERLAGVQSQITSSQEEVTQRLRLPKERSTDKDVCNIIAQYGLIYPLRKADDERNHASLVWEDGPNRVTPRPIPGKGIDPRKESARLRQYFSSLSRSSCYVAFYVFEDSFQAFNAAKTAATSCGLDYGWKPLEITEAPISFSSVGFRPKAQ